MTKLLVMGAGMMGTAAAWDMARSAQVKLVTLADADVSRAMTAAARINRRFKGEKVVAAKLDAARPAQVTRLMKAHDAALSAVPYFYNLELARAAIAAGCHFADLGGNNTVVRQELALDEEARKAGVALAPDCGLSPGLASILGGELMRRVGGRADALKIYVGGLPVKPKPPFNYQMVFSVEGLINEYAEPARVLRRGKIVDIEPLSEAEEFHIEGFPVLEAFHTSGGTSTLPETFKGKVGECFEKTLRYPGHLALIRGLYDLGLFSREPVTVGKAKVAPRALTAHLLVEKLAGEAPDVVIMRVEAHHQGGVASFTMVDAADRRSGMSAMMRTTAWPAALVVQMMVSGEIERRGAILQERDVPAAAFLEQLARRGVAIGYSQEAPK